MFKVKDQRSKSQRNVMYQQQKHYNTTMDRFSELLLGIASLLKQERAGVAHTSSCCNTLAIADRNYVFSRASLKPIRFASGLKSYGIVIKV